MSYDNILKMYFPYKHIFLITLIEWLMLKKAWTKGGHAHTLELGCKYQHIIFLFFKAMQGRATRFQFRHVVVRFEGSQDHNRRQDMPL